MIGTFEIKSVALRGEAGPIYRAWDHALDRNVAIKEYLPALLSRRHPNGAVEASADATTPAFEQGRKAFIDEARTLALCDHPSLVRVLHLIEAGGSVFRVMPWYASRVRLDVRRTMEGPLDEPALRALLRDLLGAIQAYHRVGGRHGGVTPSRVLLLDDDRPLLMGPGSASRVPGGAKASSSKDATKDAARDPATDFHDLASLARFCITGMQASAIDLGMPERLETTIARLFQNQPEMRYDADLLRGLDAALSSDIARRPKTALQFRELLDGAPDLREASESDTVDAATADVIQRVIESIPERVAPSRAAAQRAAAAGDAGRVDPSAWPGQRAAPAQRADSLRGEPANRTEPMYRAAPADRVEPMYRAAPVDRVEPTYRAAPADRVEPMYRAAPNDRVEPIARAEPPSRQEPFVGAVHRAAPAAQRVEPIVGSVPRGEAAGRAGPTGWDDLAAKPSAAPAPMAFERPKSSGLLRYVLATIVLLVAGFLALQYDVLPFGQRAERERVDAAQGAAPRAETPPAALDPATSATAAATAAAPTAAMTAPTPATPTPARPTSPTPAPAAPRAPTIATAPATEPAPSPTVAAAASPTPISSPQAPPSQQSPTPTAADPSTRSTTSAATAAAAARSDARPVQPAAVTRAAAAPVTTPTPTPTPTPSTRQRSDATATIAARSPAAPEPASTSPRQQCGARTEFALYRCMQQQCEAPRWYVHPQCVRLRTTDSVD